jgi:pyruvate/2-oxoglutarate/acetoin dehydrogenase E1 component
LVSAIRDPDPVVFMEPKRIYRALREEVPDDEYSIPLDRARIVVEGSDVTLIAWGAMLHITLQAAKSMTDKGISAEVIDIRTLSPLDHDTLIESVKKTKRAVVVHEAPRTCGLGAEIVARINEMALVYLEAPVERVTGFDTIMPLPKLEKLYLPDVGRVVHAIDRVMHF